MSTQTPVSQTQVTHAADAVYEVPDDSARQVVVDSVHKNLTSIQIPNADRYNDQSRTILHQCIHLLPVEDLERIKGRLNVLSALEDKLENKPSWFHKIFLIMQYQRVSKQTYFIVKRASNRLIDNQLKDRISVAMGSQAPVSPAATTAVVDLPTNTSNPSHLFRSRGAPALNPAAFNNVERIDLTTLQSRATGDPLVLLELRETNQHTQQFVATLQPFPLDDNNMTDMGDTTRLSNPDAFETSTMNSSEIMGPRDSDL